MITKEHANGFLQSLFPCGEYCSLANHTRSFLEGMIGRVPNGLRVGDTSVSDTDSAKKLANALRQLADHIEKGW